MSSTSLLPVNNATLSNKKFDIAIAASSSLFESALGNSLPDHNHRGVVVADGASL